MNANYNFNNDPQLLRRAAESYRARNIFLIVAEGHVVAGTDGIIARFDNDAAAVKGLEEAGYIREKLCHNLIFRPPEAP